jgi:CRISPR-associated endonuclease/helicase Cas3
MFSALLGFLKNFHVPVLCMTATLPEPRQRQLVAAGLQLSNPKPEDLKVIADAPRYRVARIDESMVAPRVFDALREGKRVLWVVNQVSRAQQRTRDLASDLRPHDVDQTTLMGPAGRPLLCYHSRFTLTNRRDRHREVIDAIRAGEPAALAVTTQVCEMSLDIDADLLVTEECPITSLIQRMGRCRRGRDELASKGPGDVLVYRPAEEKVYEPDDLIGLTKFLDLITAKAGASQADLETALERFGPTTADAPKLNSFLASGPYAMGGDDSFRDLEAFNVQAVLNGDIDKYLGARREEQPGFVLPVPKKVKPLPDSRLPQYLAVADDRHYHAATGFWDAPLR